MLCPAIFEPPTLSVLGAGSASCPQPELFSPQARATVRYADPAAWITAAAVARAIAEAGELPSEWLHQTGLVVVSDQGPQAAMAQVQAAAATGFSSPLRYSASNPGSLVGVACIAFGFRGPTLYLAMRPEDGVPVALNLCSGWLARGAARYMAVAAFSANGARALWLAVADLPGVTNPRTLSAAGWLVTGEQL